MRRWKVVVSAVTWARSAARVKPVGPAPTMPTAEASRRGQEMRDLRKRGVGADPHCSQRYESAGRSAMVTLGIAVVGHSIVLCIGSPAARGGDGAGPRRPPLARSDPRDTARAPHYWSCGKGPRAASQGRNFFWIGWRERIRRISAGLARCGRQETARRSESSPARRRDKGATWMHPRARSC